MPPSCPIRLVKGNFRAQHGLNAHDGSNLATTEDFQQPWAGCGFSADQATAEPERCAARLTDDDEGSDPRGGDPPRRMTFAAGVPATTRSSFPY